MPPSSAHHPFTLPLGYVDDSGDVHSDGVMRRATARDEIDALEHPLARRNDAYRNLLRLSRTVVRIGDITDITPTVIENLLAADFHHLLRAYDSLNEPPDDAPGKKAPRDEAVLDEAVPDVAVPGDAAPDDAPRVATPHEDAQTIAPDFSDLQLSDDATRWMTGGDLPEDLVPMLGSPSFPPADSEVRVEDTPHVDTLVPARTSGPVVTHVIEGLPGDARRSYGKPSRLRLARTPPAEGDRAQQLAALSGGELSGNGALSTITFPTGRSTSESTLTADSAHSRVSAPAAQSATKLSPSVGPIEDACDDGSGAMGVRGAMSRGDIDELYEVFLRRLRRDLLHDLERIGDTR